MRPRTLATAVSLSLTATVAVLVPTLSVLGSTGCQQLDNGGGAAGADGGVATNAIAPAGSAIGGGCGTESTSGLQLCTAVSQCPTVVVDTTAMPNCGFRVRNGVADLICACGTAVCPMGLFGTCDEAVKLLTSQTQAGVCAQISDGRCSESSVATPTATATATTPPPEATTTPTTPAAPSGGGNPACDRQCLQDCGGGGACASVCNCD